MMTPHDGFGSKEAEGLEESNVILHLLNASDTAVVAVNAALEIILEPRGKVDLWLGNDRNHPDRKLRLAPDGA